jgi:thioredoxin reductase (NADPH)
MKSYDCIVIGGGPAGLSAAIYLGRARRSVLVVDAGRGRTEWNQLNENYLGFPKGIRSRELVKRGRKQAENFGAEFSASEVLEIEYNNDRSFTLTFDKSGGESTLRARSLIFATGVTDVWPPFQNAKRYVGHSLFWCIACDGFKTCGKKVVVLGNSDPAATTALQLLNYTRDVTFLCSGEQFDVSAEKQKQMEERDIPICHGRIEKAIGKAQKLQRLEIHGGLHLELDCLFSVLGQVPNSQLAARLGVHLEESGCIKVDAEMLTNIPGVYGAGDVTNQPAQQVATAAHQGALAGTSANYFLYEDAQRTIDIGVKPAE